MLLFNHRLSISGGTSTTRWLQRISPTNWRYEAHSTRTYSRKTVSSLIFNNNISFILFNWCYILNFLLDSWIKIDFLFPGLIHFTWTEKARPDQCHFQQMLWWVQVFHAMQEKSTHFHMGMLFALSPWATPQSMFTLEEKDVSRCGTSVNPAARPQSLN